MNLTTFKEEGYQIKNVVAVDYIVNNLDLNNITTINEDTIDTIPSTIDEAIFGSTDDSYYQIMDTEDNIIYDELTLEDLIDTIEKMPSSYTQEDWYQQINDSITTKDQYDQLLANYIVADNTNVPEAKRLAMIEYIENTSSTWHSEEHSVEELCLHILKTQKNNEEIM